MLLPRGFLWAAFIGGEECPGLDPNLPNSMFVCEVTGKYNVAMPLFKIHGEEPLPNGNRRIIATTKDCVKDSETVSEAAECIQVKQAGVRHSLPSICGVEDIPRAISLLCLQLTQYCGV